MKMEQRAVLRPDMKQVQKQILSPRIIQSIEVLQLATQDLQSLLQRELVENPALEMEHADGSEAVFDREAENGEQVIDPRNVDGGAESDRLERDLEFLERYNDDFRDYAPRASLQGDEDPKMEALNNAPDQTATLEDHLRRQLGMLEVEPRVGLFADLIIQSLDERGFLGVEPEQLLSATATEEEQEDAREALRVVQMLEPAGVGARSTAEALLLQIDPSDIDYALYAKVLKNHWDDLLRNKLPKIAKDTGYDLDDIKFVIEQIATLNPYPGREFAAVSAQVVTPDVAIEENLDQPGQYAIRMIEDYLPKIRVSKDYRKLLEDAADKDTKNYLKDKIEGARALIEAIAQRQSTLERVARVILERQGEFMEVGIPGLKPLKMQEVADKIGVHVSTVSRAVADKYVETPQGTYPLKFFFVGATETAEGEDTSRNAVKAQLQQIVDNEEKAKPLSDIAIAKMLSEKFGIKIARRTVAKYRDQLAIPDSRQRREY